MEGKVSRVRSTDQNQAVCEETYLFWYFCISATKFDDLSPRREVIILAVDGISRWRSSAILTTDSLGDDEALLLVIWLSAIIWAKDGGGVKARDWKDDDGGEDGGVSTACGNSSPASTVPICCSSTASSFLPKCTVSSWCATSSLVANFFSQKSHCHSKWNDSNKKKERKTQKVSLFIQLQVVKARDWTNQLTVLPVG